ncbi:MAG: hypothetical protein ACKO2L_00150 [Planctomycetaceae bacterium]
MGHPRVDPTEPSAESEHSARLDKQAQQALQVVAGRTGLSAAVPSLMHEKVLSPSKLTFDTSGVCSRELAAAE